MFKKLKFLQIKLEKCKDPLNLYLKSDSIEN